MDEGESSGICEPLVHSEHPETAVDISSASTAGPRCKGLKYIMDRNPKDPYHNKRQAVVLAIDGGGMRGIIPD